MGFAGAPVWIARAAKPSRVRLARGRVVVSKQWINPNLPGMAWIVRCSITGPARSERERLALSSSIH
jgi:hypothetical protein